MKDRVDPILHRGQAEYLGSLLPERDALLERMEAFAAEQDHPIGGHDDSTDALRAFNTRLATDPRLLTNILAAGDGTGISIVL